MRLNWSVLACEILKKQPYSQSTAYTPTASPIIGPIQRAGAWKQMETPQTMER